MQWVFHLSQKLQDINFQTDPEDFQSHGNNCAGAVPQPLTSAFSLLICARVLYDLLNVLGPFSVILQPQNFGKVECTYISTG